MVAIASEQAWQERVDQRLGGLEAIVTRLSERLASVESTLPHLATKADLERLRAELHGEINRLIWKLAGLQAIGLLILFAALRWLS